MNISHDHAYIFGLYERSSDIYRTLLTPADESLFEYKLEGGTSLLTNTDGDVIYVDYGNGMRLRRNQRSVMVASADGGYWYGSGHDWFRLD